MELAEKYSIVRKLGNQQKRKFGSVYLIEEKSTKKKFVLKHLDKQNSSNEILTQFRNEQTFSFEETCLPKIHEKGETENDIFTILEYKEGLNLDEFWKTVKRSERISMFKKVVQGLSPAMKILENEHIAHCDLKPGNIIIQQNNDELNCILIDFGMAIRTNEEVNRGILFPLGYAAPELILNHLTIIDQRTDIFSLGIVFWKLFTNKLPLTHPNPSIYTNLQLTHPLPDIETVPKSMNELILKMAAKYQFETAPNRMDISDVQERLISGMQSRYSSFSEIAEAVQKISIKKSSLINKVLFGILGRS
jgi:serine/threonine protein kinase